MMGIFGGMVGFMRDQSYMRAVGDITNALQSRDGSSFGDAVAAQSGNTINQVFPFKSMVAWIGRWADPTQRKVDYSANVFEQTYQSVIKDVPWLNKAVSPRVSPYTGQPVGQHSGAPQLGSATDWEPRLQQPLRPQGRLQ